MTIDNVNTGVTGVVPPQPTDDQPDTEIPTSPSQPTQQAPQAAPQQAQSPYYAQGQATPPDDPILTSQDPEPQPQQQPAPQPQQPPAPKGVSPTNPNASHPLVQKAGLLHTVFQALAGGPRVTLKVNPDTGEMERTETQLTKGQIGMAIALEALGGAARGLGVDPGPGHEGRAAAAGFDQGVKQQQQIQQQKTDQATKDFARHASIVETNMKMYNNARQAGRLDMEANQKYIDSYKDTNALLDKEGGAVIATATYKDLGKYNATTQNAVPYSLIPRADPNNPGEQAHDAYGTPMWDIQYRIVDPNYMTSGAISDEMKKDGKKYNINGLNGGNLPPDLKSRLGLAVNYRAQIGAMHLEDDELKRYWDYKQKQGQTYDFGEGNKTASIPDATTQSLVDQYAEQYGVPIPVARSLIMQESGGKQFGKDGSVLQGKPNHTGELAVGAGQLLPSTAKKMGVDPNTLDGNINGSMQYLGGLIKQYNGNLPLALAAYHSGPGNVTDHVPQNGQGTPEYVNAIMGNSGATGQGKVRSTGDVKPVDLSEFAQKNGRTAKAVQDFQGYQNKTDNLTQALAAFAHDNPDEGMLMYQLYGGRDAAYSYDNDRASDKKYAQDQEAVRKAGSQAAATAHAKVAEFQDKLNNYLKIPTKDPVTGGQFQVPSNLIDMSDADARSWLTTHGVNVPPHLEQMRAIASYREPLSSESVKTWMTGNPGEWDQQSVGQFINTFLNPEYNSERYQDIKDEHAYFTKGKGADQMQSANTLFDHLGAAVDANNAYTRANGGGVYAQKPMAWFKTNLQGDPMIYQLGAAIEPVKDEFFSFLKNNRALSQHDEQAGNNIMNYTDMNPQVLLGQLKTFATTAALRLKETDNRYQRTMGVGRTLPGLVSPDALQGIGKLRNADGTNPVADILKDMDAGGDMAGGIYGRHGKTVGEALGIDYAGQGKPGNIRNQPAQTTAPGQRPGEIPQYVNGQLVGFTMQGKTGMRPVQAGQ